MKLCPVCGETKPVEDFPKKPNKCKSCHNSAQRKWRAEHPGKYAEYVKRWQLKNPAKLKTSAKNWHKKNPDYNKQYLNDRVEHRYFRKLERQYGLTVDQYRKLQEDQDFKCAICGSDGPLVVDHNHKTNKVRGLLCATCNSGVGLLKDSPKVLKRAAEYIAAFK